MIKESINRNLSINSILLIAGTILNKGLQFIMIPLFSRWLSTSEYVRFDLISTYVSLLIPVVTLACGEGVFRFGIEQSLVREKGKHIMNGLTIVTINSIIMAIIILTLRFCCNWTLAAPFYFLALGEILNNYVQAYMRAIRKHSVFSFLTAFSTLCIFALSTVFILWFKMGTEGIIWGYALGFLIGDIIALIVTGFKSYFDIGLISCSGIKTIIEYSCVLIPNNICWWVINVSDRSIINMYLGDSYNGIYAIASKIPNLATAVFSMFSISWQETATDMVNSSDRNSYYNSIFNKICTILIPLCGCIVASSFILFGVIFDYRYSDASNYMPILVTSVFFYTLSQFLGGIQISLKEPRANTITTIVGAITNLIIHFSMVRMIGLYAAAISTVVSNIVIFAMRYFLLRKSIVLRIEKQCIIYIVAYVYIICASYICFPTIISVFNLAFSLVWFITVNREILIRLLRNAVLLKSIQRDL